jgi:hypothetical protein
MEIPTITPQDISSFHALHSEFKQIKEQADAALVVARGNSENEITIARGGKAVTVKEGVLWDEIWNLGTGAEASQILGEKYPEAFKLAADTEAKKGEMKAFAMTKWDIDPMAMSLSDIIRLIEGVVASKNV